MPIDFTSMCISTAIALVGGVWLGYFLAANSPSRIYGWYFVLWLWALLPLPLTTATGALHALPLVAVFSLAGFHSLRDYHNAARSLGAGEWRIFWRVSLPSAWKSVLNGVLLAVARLIAERYLANRV